MALNGRPLTPTFKDASFRFYKPEWVLKRKVGQTVIIYYAGQGVFTYYLLEGLRGMADLDGDGVITVDEQYTYVSKKVPEATGKNQNPV